MRILILGGDGYLGWPTALRFSARRRRGRGRRQLQPAALGRGRGLRLADPDRRPRDPDRRLGGDLRQADPVPHRPDRGRRLPRRRRRRLPPRRDRPLRPAGLGALLDDLPPDRGRDPVREHDRQPQPALLDARPRPRGAPGEARDDGRVRPAQHRHRGGLHRDLAQGAQRHAAVPEAAGLAVPLLEGPRLDQHPLRLPHLGPARDRPEPGRRLRDRDRGDGQGRAADHALRLRRALRHGSEPLLSASRDRSSPDRLRRRQPDAQLPQHPGHARLRRDRRRRTRRPPASSASSTSSPSSSR